MQLVCHSDASYLSVSNSLSHAGGHYFLSSPPDFKNNGAIHSMSQIIRHVMASATEAEIDALYMNARESVAICNDVELLGHKQHPTLLQTDSATAKGIINKKMQPKREKSMDMQFHWLCDRNEQKQIKIFGSLVS